jgi:DNA-binding winged helix-turn-helix (wHTH) protein
LRHGEERIHLTPKAFELLAILIEQRPRAVAKAVLQERLWPKTFVADANLAILVSEVREALDDTARTPTFIRTVHGFGYAFCGAVSAVSAPPQTTAPATCWLVSKTRHVALHEGENIVGREPLVDVWLDARGISRRHARITVDGAQARLEDLDSKNGTWLEGQRLTSISTLADGNQIRFGSFRMTFRVWSDGGSTDTTGSI